MRTIIGYIKRWFYETDKRILAIVSVLTGLLIWANYHYGIDKGISDHEGFIFSFFSRAGIFLVAFGLPYLANGLLTGKNYFSSVWFICLLIIAPFIFSLKIALNPHFGVSSNWNTSNFWNHVFYWPV